MCGIAGVISASGDETSIYLNTMLRSMQHRGPDGAGIMIGGEVQHRINWRIWILRKEVKLGWGMSVWQ
jgi:asparagine synthetase B (glutamine-hydrolysing)